MSTYPTTAELAAFRRSIAYNRDGQAYATSLAYGYVPKAIAVKAPGQWHGAVLSHEGARAEELRDGIGYRETHHPDHLYSWTRERHPVESDAERRSGGAVVTILESRREASALRSRAYAAKGMASQWLVPVHPKSGGAWYAERVDGAPYQWHTYGRRDGIVASDTWSEDDAPRSPLPIRYQAAFIITR